MAEYIRDVGANSGRGSYASAAEAGLKLAELRERLSAMFGFADARACILTSGATYSINMMLHGLLKRGDRVITTSMEHNAVMRPLRALERSGVAVDRAKCAPDGSLDPAAVERLITPQTSLIVMLHASNVCGTLLPVGDVGEIARRARIPLVVDAAQTAGHIAIDAMALNISALAVPAHKGLLGPSGFGAALMTREFAERLSPIVQGGTGSESDSEEQPESLPDKLEAGTPNLPAAYGLSAALDYIERRGIDSIAAHERTLTSRFLAGLAGTDGIFVLGPADASRRMAAVSVDFRTMDNAEAAYNLEKEFKILTRCGLHCAPAAHKTLGTFPNGAVRFSFGSFNTESDADYAARAVRELAKR